MHATATTLRPPHLSNTAAATYNAARLRGSDPLLNAYVIHTDTQLSNLQATFLLCHRLTIELPFLSATPYCHPDCGRVPHPPNRYTGDLITQECNSFAHGYHQSSCSKFNFATTRHDEWINAHSPQSSENGPLSHATPANSCNTPKIPEGRSTSCSSAPTDPLNKRSCLTPP